MSFGKGHFLLNSDFSEFATETNMLERLNRALFSDGIGEEDAESGVPLAQVAWQRLRADIICGRIAAESPAAHRKTTRELRHWRNAVARSVIAACIRRVRRRS